MTLPPTFVRDFHHESCERMKYRPFGKTGLQVSEISLGGAAFSKIYGDINEKEAIATIREAIKSGVNYLDTAPWYGQGKSLEIFGEALKDIPREAYYIATKIGRYDLQLETMFDFSATRTRESIEDGLKLLGLEYVDIIQIHDIEFAPNFDILLNETLPEVEALIKEGKAKFVGITGYCLKTLREFILAAPNRIDMILTYSRYTLFDNSLTEYLPFLLDQQLGIVCASGLGMGLLTTNGPPDWHPAPEDIKEQCRKAACLCQVAGMDIAKLAMYHFTALEGPSTFLTGMQTRQQLDANLSAYCRGLNKKEQEMLKRLQEEVFVKSSNWQGVELERYWTKIRAIRASKTKA